MCPDFELLVAFDRIDSSDDRRMDRGEFDAAIPTLCGWGVQINDLDTAFSSIDSDGSGTIIFEEFCVWALATGLDLDPSDNVADESTLPARHVSSAVEAARAARDTAARVRELDERAKATATQGHGDETQSVDLRALVAKLPVDEGRTAERKDLFARCDVNGNGVLTLSEVQIGMATFLGTDGADTVQAFAPAVKRAYQAARHAASDASGGAGSAVGAADVVGQAQFRALLIYLKLYFELLAVFDRIDTNDDRRVDASEFSRALPLLAGWGVHVTDPAAEFRAMDTDGGGLVLFIEFAGWALRKGLDVWLRDAHSHESGTTHHREELVRAHTRALRERPAGTPSKRMRAATTARPRPQPINLAKLLEVPGAAGLSLAALCLKLPCGPSAAEQGARHELFDKLDADGDGMLQAEDVAAGLRTLLSGANSAGNAGGPPATPGSPPRAADLGTADDEPAALRDAFAATTRLQPPGGLVDRATFRRYLCNLKWSLSAANSTQRAPAPPPFKGKSRPQSAIRTGNKPTAAELFASVYGSPRPGSSTGRRFHQLHFVQTSPRVLPKPPYIPDRNPGTGFPSRGSPRYDSPIRSSPRCE